MTWRPVPQPPCPCTTYTAEPAMPVPAVITEGRPPLRVCGTAGCTHCPPVTPYTPGGGDRLPARPGTRTQ